MSLINKKDLSSKKDYLNVDDIYILDIFYN